MNITTTPAKTYLLSRHQILFSEMMQIADKAVDSIYGELKKRQLTPAGSIEFIYHNFSQDKPFLLEIAMPVEETAEVAGDDFSVVKRDAFRHINHVHNGGMSSMMNTYNTLFAEIGAKGMPYNGEVREVYVKFSGPEAADNVTEIQIGLN